MTNQGRRDRAETLVFLLSIILSLNLFWSALAWYLGRHDWVDFAKHCLFCVMAWVAYNDIRKLRLAAERNTQAKRDSEKRFSTPRYKGPAA